MSRRKSADKGGEDEAAVVLDPGTSLVDCVGGHSGHCQRNADLPAVRTDAGEGNEGRQRRSEPNGVVGKYWAATRHCNEKGGEMSEYAKTVAIDVDGVLAQYDGWKGPDVIGDPIPGARGFLEELNKRGFRIVIHTTRTRDFEGTDHKARCAAVKKWLVKHNLPHHVLHTQIGKPIACAYVDDRAVPCRPSDDDRVAFNTALVSINFLSKDEK